MESEKTKRKKNWKKISTKIESKKKYHQLGVSKTKQLLHIYIYFWKDQFFFVITIIIYFLVLSLFGGHLITWFHLYGYWNWTQNYLSCTLARFSSIFFSFPISMDRICTPFSYSVQSIFNQVTCNQAPKNVQLMNIYHQRVRHSHVKLHAVERLLKHPNLPIILGAENNSRKKPKLDKAPTVLANSFSDNFVWKKDVIVSFF